jgi:hypothetical protein
MPDPTLAGNMIGAWAQRANAARAVIQTATVAPALVKPEAVEQARRDHAKAVSEMQRWAS